MHQKKNKSASSKSSTISTRHMQYIIEELRMKTTRDSTMGNYCSIWRKFNRFLVRLDAKPKKWEKCVALYGAYLVNQGTQSSTIKSYFSAIKKLLLQCLGYRFNDDEMLLASITQACKIQNDKIKTRLPISSSMLDQILFEVA